MEDLRDSICKMVLSISDESILLFINELVSDAFTDCQATIEQAS